MLNIYIIGAQCTGKSTLVDALEDCYKRSTYLKKEQHPLVIREVARKVLKEKHFNRSDITTSGSRSLEFQQHILAAQFLGTYAIDPDWTLSRTLNALWEKVLRRRCSRPTLGTSSKFE